MHRTCKIAAPLPADKGQPCNEVSFDLVAASMNEWWFARRQRSFFHSLTLVATSGDRHADSSLPQRLLRMKRLLALAALLIAAQPCFAATARPNILFILADDLGWRDLSCYGSPFNETPHLDRLAHEGMRFTQAYSAGSICSPTRASLMTGKYPVRTGITDYIPGL